VTSPSEIYRTARLLVEEYGEMAPVGAALRADHLEQTGDKRGSALWLRIVKAAEDLLTRERPEGATLH
jgi:hypothetical protein